jgi:putative component of toxin-antitoxin plasmid stabilization module
VSFISRREQLLILLAGGDKQSQARDIQAAHDLAQSL